MKNPLAQFSICTQKKLEKLHFYHEFSSQWLSIKLFFSRNNDVKREWNEMVQELIKK